MKTNLKVILSAIGLAALLASPAMAKSNARHRDTVQNRATAGVSVPGSYVYGYTGSNQETISDRWRATHSNSWDATHDPRENPQL
jgi:hypothetical protein